MYPWREQEGEREGDKEREREIKREIKRERESLLYLWTYNDDV